MPNCFARTFDGDRGVRQDCAQRVQNSVIYQKIVKNLVMNAKIDPKVVMDLSIFKIGGWNSLQPMNQNLLEVMSMNLGC